MQRNLHAIRILSFAFCFLLVARTGFSQQNFAEKADSLLKNYGSGFAASKLHLHVDKSIYTPNETIWFSAFLYSIIPDSFNHQLLYVKLLQNDNDSLVRSAIFPFVQNHSNGQFLLPAALPTGMYKIIAYTDQLINGMPAVVFRQQLQIKTEAQPEFLFQLRLLDSIANNKDSFRVMLTGRQQNGQALPNAVLPYELVAGKKSLIKRTATLNEKGEAQLVFPRSLQQSLSLKLQLQQDGKKQSFQLPVQQPIAPPQVRFYPEGGHMLAGHSTWLPVEVTVADGFPIQSELELFENGQRILASETNTHGVGFLNFTPQLNKQYFVRVGLNGVVHEYPLPASQAKGYSLMVADGVADDSIRITVQMKDVLGRCKLIVHNFKEVFWAAEINAAKDELYFSISSQQFPTGVYALTLTNEVLQPLSERLIFVHHNQKAIQIQTGKSLFQPRENVALQITTQDSASLQQLSVSCVAMTRVDFHSYSDILTGLFLKDELNDFTSSALYFLRGRKDRLNEILLTKGWRQYNWQQVLEAKLKPVVVGSLQPTKGKVMLANEKGPFELALVNDKGLHPYTTDSAGNFTLALEHLVSPMEKRLFLAPVKLEGKKKKPLILMDTAYKIINRRMDTIGLVANDPEQRFISSSQTGILPSQDPKSMAVVVIAAKSKLTNFKSKTCNDWVCQYNILNCENHPYGGVPVDGERYLYREMRGAATTEVIYIGCESVSLVTPKEFVSLPKISIGKTFYKPDYNAQPETPPEYLTTLYWNPLLPMKEGKFNDSFFTSDAKGVFMVLVNGLIDGRPVQAYQTFEVK